MSMYGHGDDQVVGYTYYAGDEGFGEHTTDAIKERSEADFLALNKVRRDPTTGAIIRNQFHVGICGCFSTPGVCQEATFCSCCQLSRQYNFLHHREPRVHRSVCLVSAILLGVPLLCYNASVRRQIKDRYRLKETDSADESGRDCVVSFFCPCCAIGQQMIEMAGRDDFAGATCVEQENPRVEKAAAPRAPAPAPAPAPAAAPAPAPAPAPAAAPAPASTAAPRSGSAAAPGAPVQRQKSFTMSKFKKNLMHGLDTDGKQKGGAAAPPGGQRAAAAAPGGGLPSAAAATGGASHYYEDNVSDYRPGSNYNPLDSPR